MKMMKNEEPPPKHEGGIFRFDSFHAKDIDHIYEVLKYKL